jgi:hypothetical protein
MTIDFARLLDDGYVYMIDGMPFMSTTAARSYLHTLCGLSLEDAEKKLQALRSECLDRAAGKRV